MNRTLQGIKNVESSMDDILIHAESKEKLEETTKSVIKRLEQVGLRLNKEKCKFCKQNVKFLGHILTPDGIKPDEEKIEAIRKLKTPQNMQELQRLLSMTTYLSKFIPNLSTLTEPLRVLLIIENSWTWTEHQEEAVEKIKKALEIPPVLL